jgi:hypothetical protein
MPEGNKQLNACCFFSHNVIIYTHRRKLVELITYIFDHILCNCDLYDYYLLLLFDPVYIGK